MNQTIRDQSVKSRAPRLTSGARIALRQIIGLAESDIDQDTERYSKKELANLKQAFRWLTHHAYK